LFPVANFLKCVATEVVLFSIFAFETLIDLSQGSEATHLRCGGIFSDGIIINFPLILVVKYFENRLIFAKVKAYKILLRFFGPPCKYSSFTFSLQVYCGVCG